MQNRVVTSAPEKGEAKVKTRRIDPADKMERVVRTARRLFVERGYHNVSIPLIVQTSGVSTGAIYNYFPNKEAMARHIHEQTLDEFHGLFRQRLEGRVGAYEKLRTFAELVYDLAEQDPDMMEYLMFMKHCEFMPDAAPICLSEPFRLIREIIADGMKEGVVRPGEPFIFGVSFTGAVLRAVELRFRCVLDRPLTDLAEELIANAWAAIRA